MTAVASLKSLTLIAFRGSTATFKLDFEKGKKLTLIYGENGTGKTTICDGFEFLASEKVGSIEDRGMGKGLEKFWHAAGKTAADLHVELETNAGKCTGKIANKKVLVTPISARKGGGGFRYYELAPSLLAKDKWGREVISKEYNPAMLAQALCKLEGFTYSPSPDLYWQQGNSSESDFLYVTTQTLGPEELAALSEDVGEGRSLLILCAAFRGDAELWPNLTIRKIPNHIRARCEWGRDDYSLNVANLPQAEVKAASVRPQPSLFEDGDAA